jgi:putative tryptophan/tyrosine transport system permease protein
MDLWIGAVNLGFLYALMALGTFITYRYFNIADITIDGSFTLGAATGAILIVDGWNPFLVLPVSFLAGACAGFITGFIHTRFKIDGLLAGILVMTGLYSVNLHVMGKSNIPLMNHRTFETVAAGMNPGLHQELWTCILLFAVMAAVWLLLSAFLKSDLGLTMLATGNNPTMISAQGVSTNRMKMLGITLANGMVGLSGILIAQYQGFADIGMGMGSIIYSLAAVIIGQALFRTRKVWLAVLGVILGAVLFRLAVALALKSGFDPNDLKILTALFVLLTLVISKSVKSGTGKERKLRAWVRKYRKLIISVLILTISGWMIFLIAGSGRPAVVKEKKVRIGIVLANHSSVLTKTRDGFVNEMKKLGYVNGRNCLISELNAEGDIPANKAMVDKLISDKTDLFLAFSSASTQAVVNKVKDKPVVFATVASPFILGAGKTPIDHPANVTGVYGQAPVAKLLGMLLKFYPGPVRIGTIYNPGFPNTRVNLGDLRKAVKDFPQITLEEMSVSGTAEVQQAAQSLASKGIRAFYLITDLTVFDAFESVLKVSRANRIPIFANDADCLERGAFLVYGYEFYTSGVQAARLADRIIRGESPAGIPYEHYARCLLGINRDQAVQFGMTIPDTLVKAAEAVMHNDKYSKKTFSLPFRRNPDRVAKIAVFQYANSVLLNRTVQGLRDILIREKYARGRKLDITFYDAHGDYGTAQSIAKDIISKDFDYIATASTLALQTLAAHNKTVPQVFAAVTDPVKAGVARTMVDHQANLTGLATPQPVASTIHLMRTLLPKARKVGMIWTCSEINSEICTKWAREACAKEGFILTEKTVTSVGEVDEAVKSLIASGIDIFFVSGDVTVSQALPVLGRIMQDARIPFFSNSSDDIYAGTLISVGASYYDVGKRAAGILLGVMDGASPGDIPIEVYVPKTLAINLALARMLGVSIPDSVVQKAVIKLEKY